MLQLFYFPPTSTAEIHTKVIYTDLLRMSDCVTIHRGIHFCLIEASSNRMEAPFSPPLDANKCLDGSVSHLFFHSTLSSHGLVVLRKTGSPIVPHKAPNADTAVA